MGIMLLKLNNDEKGAIMLETMLMKLRRKLRSHQMMLHSLAPCTLFLFRLHLSIITLQLVNFRLRYDGY